MAARRDASSQNPFGNARPGSAKWWITFAGITLALASSYCAKHPWHFQPSHGTSSTGTVSTGNSGRGSNSGGVTFAGLPKGQDVQVLENDGFTDGFSPTQHIPLWAVYRATDPRQGPTLPRPETFSHDPRAPESADSADYARTGYDRGHMAPNGIISKLYGATAQNETFLLSNVSPQTPRLNQLAWQRLEEAEANQLAPRLGTVWVTMGPVISPEDGTLGHTNIRVPYAFFRIWVARDEKTGTLSALAFVMPQAVRGDEDLTQFVATIDDIESLTGLDFFSDLDDVTEKALESTPADGRWQLDRFARSAGRYAQHYRDRPGAALGNGQFAPKTRRPDDGADTASGN